MTENFGPQLSREAAAALSIPPEEGLFEWPPPPYGEPLSRAVARTPFEWLESALRAGHLPTPEGLTLAIQATYTFWEEELEKFEAQGFDGDAEFTASMAGLWRDIAVTAEDCAARMEEHLARLARKTAASREDHPLAPQLAFDAGAAERRAARARDRASSALRDGEEAQEAGRRYR